MSARADKSDVWFAFVWSMVVCMAIIFTTAIVFHGMNARIRALEAQQEAKR